MIRKYIIEIPVPAAGAMWDFVRIHRLVVRGLSKIKAEPEIFKYELRMDNHLVTVFVLSVGPVSCIEKIE